MDLLNSLSIWYGLIPVGFLVLMLVRTVLKLRRVVSTNDVHIVQSSKKTTSYGKDTGNGNTYYEWPSWLPLLGITKVILPVSVFDLNLKGYEAYDKGRLPFVVDVTAFFRIIDSNVAAQRVSSFEELHNQLTAVVQGAVRTILANNEIEEIMQGRSKFGNEFTQEVDHQLANWGVTTVKSIELMDIRDSKDSHVIHNIMSKKKSHIEMQSRVEVANNSQLAETAEIEATRKISLQTQEANQQVGLRTVQQEREVELARQQKEQAVKEQEKLTKEKEMSIRQVQQVREAEISKQVNVVKANQDKETMVLVAEGQLETERLKAEGVTLNGQAKANAEKAMQLAPVEAQITLAKEIGSNGEYQKYLITVRQIEATEQVGMKQAEALSKAEIKVIANTGSPNSGLNNVMDLFTSKGGTQLGAMLDGLANTEKGEELLNTVLPIKSKSKT